MKCLDRSVWIAVAMAMALYTGRVGAVEVYTPQQPDPVLDSWRWTEYPQLHGKGVTCAFEAADHTLWFGTAQGISHYDGLTWTHYALADSVPGLPIRALRQGKDGCLLAAGQAGLAVLSGIRWDRLFPRAGAPPKTVFCLNTLPDGTLLAGLDAGVVHIAPDRVTFYGSGTATAPKGVSQWCDQVRTIGEPSPDLRGRSNTAPDLEGVVDFNLSKFWDVVRSPDGTIWFVTATPALVRADWGHGNEGEPYPRWTVYPFPEEASGLIPGYMDLHQMEDGRLWIATSNPNRPVYQFDPSDETWTHLDLSRLPGGHNVNMSVVQTRDHGIWISGEYRFFRYAGGTWQVYSPHQAPIPNSKVVRLLETDDGSLWFLGQDSGVSRLDLSNEQWQTYPGLNFQDEAADATQWFTAADNRVVSHSQGQWMAFGTEDGLMDAPSAILVGRDHRVWVAGSHEHQAAVAYGDGRRWIRRVHPEFSWGVDPKTLFESRDGRVWFGAERAPPNRGYQGGLLCYVPTTPGEEPRIEQYPVQTQSGQIGALGGITQTHDGSIWFGGRLGWLRDGLIGYVDDPVFQRVRVVSLHTTAQDCLWAGCRGDGLFRRDNGLWTHYSVEDGLPSNTIVDIVQSGDGNLWVATDRDIVCFNGQNWTHGLFISDLWTGQEGGTLRPDDQGAFWINASDPSWGLRGHPSVELRKDDYPSFRTVRYRPKREPPETHMVQFQEEVSPPGNVLLAWSGADRWNLTPVQGLTYSYRLDEGPWSRFATETNHTFLELRPGWHGFEVRAMDRDLNVDPNPAAVRFRVLSPVWRQPWFILLMSVMILAIVVLSRLLIKLHERHVTWQLEIEKLRVEQQLEMDELRLRFFTNISHELRTPLTLILGPIESLLRTLADPGAKGKLILVHRNAQRLLRLVNQLLDMRKLQEGQLKLATTEDDIVRFIGNLVESFVPEAQRQGLSLRFHTTDASLTMRFDPDKLEKIVSNLLSNAIKFTPTSGQIDVSVAASESVITLTVEDTGEGIGPEDLPRLFDRFYQAERHAGRSGGTGIGLALTKDLVEMHGGTISVVSPVHARADAAPGSRFAVELPRGAHTASQADGDDRLSQGLCEAEAVSAQGTPETAESVGTQDRPQILVVEDSSDMRAFMRDELSDEYEIQEAVHGRQGFDLAREAIPDLIVSDVMMPEMDGLALCQALRANPLTCHIPVILLTARGSEEAQVQGLQTGADDYITKPFSCPLLKARIRNLLDSRRRLQEYFTRQVLVQPREITVTSMDAQFLQQAMDAVEKHMADSDFDAECLAGEMCLSRSTLYRKLKGLTGQPVNAFIKTVRLKRAAQLLSQGGLPVAEVAFQVGFLDRVYFSACFREQFGEAPSEYRSRIAQRPGI